MKLIAEKRKIIGKKVKKLRKEGILPANVYGKKVKSLAIQLPLKVFLPVYKEVGETGIVELKVEKEEKTRPVLIHNVQLDPVSDNLLHVDFYQVDLKEKITTPIPVELVGEAPAVSQKIGILIQPLSEVEVEALPAELPDKLTVSIDSLQKVDDAVTVKDLKPPAGVKILTSLGQILAKIEPPAKEEVAPSPPKEEVPAEEKPTEEKPAEGKKEEKQPVEETKKKPPVKSTS